MATARKKMIAERFNRLSFHDDNLLSVIIRPPQTRRNRTRIDFSFAEYLTGRKKLLSFLNCANVRYIMDFDVMADNSFAQGDASAARIDDHQMTKLVNNQRRHWHNTYMPPLKKNQPIVMKLSKIQDYILFRVTFFGGTAEILAQNYRLSRRR